VRKNTSELIVF